MKKLYLTLFTISLLTISYFIYLKIENYQEQEKDKKEYEYALNNIDKIGGGIKPLSEPHQRALLWHIENKKNKESFQKLLWYYLNFDHIDDIKNLLEKNKKNFNEEKYFDHLIIIVDTWNKPIDENMRNRLNIIFNNVKKNNFFLEKVCNSSVYDFSISKNEYNPQYQHNINANDKFFQDLIILCKNNVIKEDTTANTFVTK